MKTLYWVSTALVSLFALVSAMTYLLHEQTIRGVSDLGFPRFFRLQLAGLKLIAAPVLLLPLFSVQAKEWAYAGLFFFLLTAAVAHLVHRDSPALQLILVVILGLLATSNVLLHRGVLG